MQTIEVERLGTEIHSLIAAAQTDDVFITDHGKVVAVVSRPKPVLDEAYWRKREALLAEVVVDPGWDSTKAISEDRDRF